MIPYTVERRADTGVTNVTMGVWLFLASEVMLFGALFSAYALLRTSATSWPTPTHTLSWGLAVVNTVILALAFAVLRRRAATTSAARQALAISSLLALAFLAVKAFEYQREIAAGLVPATSTFFAMYFTLTGVHAVHVIAGILANLWALAGAAKVGDAMTAGRLQALRLYWGFVDLVWLTILIFVYLV
jgi:heme/copper-type cytochrome/quinol oxidase subunit 3